MGLGHGLERPKKLIRRQVILSSLGFYDNSKVEIGGPRKQPHAVHKLTKRNRVNK